MAIQLLFVLLNAFFIRRFLAMLFSSALDPSRVSSCATSQVISSDSRVAARGYRHFDKRPRRESCVRWGMWVLALMALCLSALGGFAPSAEAQTSHFSSALSTLGSGFSLPYVVSAYGKCN